MGCRSSSTAVDPAANGSGGERKSSGSTTLPDDSLRTGSDLPSLPPYPSDLSPSNKSVPKLSLPYHFQEEIDEATKLAHALAAASVATSSVASTPVASLALSMARAKSDPPAGQVQVANEAAIPESDVYVTSIEEEEELPAMAMHTVSSLKSVEHVDEPHQEPPRRDGGNAELASLTSQEMKSVPSGAKKAAAGSVRRHVSGLSSSSSSAEVCVESPGKVALEREDSIEMLDAVPEPIFPPQEDNRWAVPMPGTIEDEDIVPFPPAGPKPPHVARRNEMSVDDEMLMNTIMTENLDRL
mmetsp:Transcript_46811/g.85711  ORF Transcript_46811/g.85711 Transcript_46811/m.85711 type:complete len:298 (+) Transcript_46811:50-943(+)